MLPASAEGVESFDADDRAAQLNGGSYHAIQQSVRDQVNREFESFVTEHIRGRVSFALETTLRSDITFKQSAHAKAAGFEVIMHYVALESVEMNLARVRARADSGGHSASESRLRAIHAASLKNLPMAMREIERVVVYDNSRVGGPTELLMTTRDARVEFVADHLPGWLLDALRDTEFVTWAASPGMVP